MSIVAAEADDDVRDAEEEGLSPPFLEAAFEFHGVPGKVQGGHCFELNPVDGFGGGGGGFGVPYCGEVVVAWSVCVALCFVGCSCRKNETGGGRTCVYFTCQDHLDVSNAGCYDRDVLCVVVDYRVLAALDDFAAGVCPWGREDGQSFELVA